MYQNGRRARRCRPVRRYACSVSRIPVRRAFVIILLALVATASAGAQTSRTSTKKPASRPATSKTASARPPAPPVREAPLMQCPSILGNGATTQRLYCDVLGGADPTAGLRVTLPPHAGPLTLSFTLHNRQTFSESEVKAGRAFARYTATLRVVSGAGEVLGQAVVRSEFRTEKDLVERIAGGAGPGGVKAVAPTGAERVVLTVDEGVEEVILSGERLTIERVGGTEVVTAPGRPYAVVSGVEIEYRPAPPAPPRTKRQRR